MNIRRTTGYAMVAAGILGLLAAGILVGTNWGNHNDLSLFGKIVYSVSLGKLMLLSAAGGMVLVLLAGLLRRGIRTLRKNPAAPKVAPPAATPPPQ